MRQKERQWQILLSWLKAYTAHYNAVALIANEDNPFIDAETGEVVEALN